MKKSNMPVARSQSKKKQINNKNDKNNKSIVKQFSSSIKKVQVQNKVKKTKYENKNTLSSYCKNNQNKKNVKQHMKPANRQQFRKYLDNTENTFYQNSFNGFTLRFIQSVRPFLTKSFIILFLFYVILMKVQPYKGVCPSHAQCGVYIHCKAGYQLSPSNQCVISQQTKQEGKLICMAVIQNLQFKYGNYECENKEYQGIPYKQIKQVYNEFEIKNEALKQELFNWFQDKQNQKKYFFYLYNQSIAPNKKLYSLSCKVSMLIESKQFKVYMVLFIIFSVLITLCIKRIRLNKKAEKIYNDLKQIIKQEGDIQIDSIMLKKKYGNINEQLWQLIDKLRYKDGKIVYYEVDMLHWKLI